MGGKEECILHFSVGVLLPESNVVLWFSLLTRGQEATWPFNLSARSHRSAEWEAGFLIAHFEKVPFPSRRRMTDVNFNADGSCTTHAQNRMRRWRDKACHLQRPVRSNGVMSVLHPSYEGPSHASQLMKDHSMILRYFFGESAHFWRMACFKMWWLTWI